MAPCILVAPNAFKESLDAVTVTRILVEVMEKECPGLAVRGLPVADGGDGTADVLQVVLGGRKIPVDVTGPLGERRSATWVQLADPGRGVIEMATACGLSSVPPEQRNPLHTGSRGLGQLILAAVDAGVKEILLGLGGSATVDGGLGLLQALGVRFLNDAGRVLPAPLSGGDLARVACLDPVDLDPRLARIRLRVACDVDNPLLGARGAAAVFGPQKGATPDMVEVLEAGLARLAGHFEQHFGRAVAEIPGAGAAGGVGAALHAALGATLEPGADLVLGALEVTAALEDVVLVVTGEGCLDASSLGGKAPVGVARRARSRGIPVVAFCGRCVMADVPQLSAVFDRIIEMTPRGLSWPEAKRGAATLLATAARAFCRKELPALLAQAQR